MDYWITHVKLEILAYVRIEAHYVYIMKSRLPEPYSVNHGLGYKPVQIVPGTESALTHCWVGEQFRCCYTSIVKFTLPLNADLVYDTSYLLQSCQSLFRI